MSKSPIPRSETELVPWLGNFREKLANYAVTLGLTVPEVEQTQSEIDYAVYLINVRVPSERQTLAATVEFKNLMLEGEGSATLPVTLPGTTAPPAYPTAVPAGILGRLRKLVQNIKTRPGYTETIGHDLNIISGSAVTYPEAPTVTLATAKAGAVTLDWNKGGWTGVRFQSRAKGGEWTDLGIDLYSPFVDTRPLGTPFQPEGREYRACYLDGDTSQPSFSPVLEVTVAP
jgi:hypothetical protein